MLVREGDVTDDIYFVESGTLTATVVSEAGASIRVRTMGPGTVIGEVAMYTRKPRSASVVAESPCTLHRLSRSALEAMLETTRTRPRGCRAGSRNGWPTGERNLRIVRVLLQ